MVGTLPQTIFLRVPPRKSEELVDLVIDAAGKVREAKIVGAADRNMIAAAAVWNRKAVRNIGRQTPLQPRPPAQDRAASRTTCRWCCHPGSPSRSACT